MRRSCVESSDFLADYYPFPAISRAGWASLGSFQQPGARPNLTSLAFSVLCDMIRITHGITT